MSRVGQQQTSPDVTCLTSRICQKLRHYRFNLQILEDSSPSVWSDYYVCFGASFTLSFLRIDNSFIEKLQSSFTRHCISICDTFFNRLNNFCPSHRIYCTWSPTTIVELLQRIFENFLQWFKVLLGIWYLLLNDPRLQPLAPAHFNKEVFLVNSDAAKTFSAAMNSCCERSRYFPRARKFNSQNIKGILSSVITKKKFWVWTTGCWVLMVFLCWCMK